MDKVVMTFNIPTRTREKLEFISNFTGLGFTSVVINAIDAAYDDYHFEKMQRKEANMSIKGLYLDEEELEKVNAALIAAGYASYPGDRTTDEPEGCGAGYVMNLLDAIAGADPDARREVEGIVREVCDG